MCYYNKTTFWVVRIFFAFKLQRENFDPILVRYNKTLSQQLIGGGNFSAEHFADKFAIFAWWTFKE